MNFDTAYELALQKKTQKLNTITAKYEADVQQLYDSSSDYRKIVNELSAIGPKLAVTAFSGDTKEFESLQKKAKQLNEAKKAILSANGLSGIKYDCDICKDTGFVGVKICECVKKEASNLILAESKDVSANSDCNFDNFNIGFYPDQPDKPISHRKQMASIFNYVVEYTRSFSKTTNESLLFMGKTGLGKTFLSLCVYNELIKRGFNVTYKPAFNLFSAIENEHFRLRTDDTYTDAITTDLLIIDDLGTEFSSPYSKSVFYNIINSRLLAEKPTIINTNLSLEEIEKNYSPRISSRIFGNYTVKNFVGIDIRQLKKASEVQAKKE